MINRIMPVVSWALFVSAFAFWFGKTIGGLNLETWIVLVVLIPVVEETTKFIAYRGLRGEDTLGIPLIFLTGETLYITRDAVYNTADFFILFTALVLMGLTQLKHILFWAVPRAARFRLWSLPLAIGAHALWNLYVMTDPPLDSIAAGLIALLCVWFAFLLFREQKGVNHV